MVLYPTKPKKQGELPNGQAQQNNLHIEYVPLPNRVQDKEGLLRAGIPEASIQDYESADDLERSPWLRSIVIRPKKKDRELVSMLRSWMQPVQPMHDANRPAMHQQGPRMAYCGEQSCSLLRAAARQHSQAGRAYAGDLTAMPVLCPVP
jgi:hypothetical protein